MQPSPDPDSASRFPTFKRLFSAVFAWRTIRRSLFVVVCLATLLALVFAVENWRGKRAWEQFKAEWEAKGERFEIADFAPPKVPDEENFAMTPLLAPLLDYQFRPGGKGAHWRDPSAHDHAMSLALPVDNAGGLKTPSLGQWDMGQPIDLKAWQQYLRAGGNVPGNGEPLEPAAAILLALGKFERELQELQTASQRPYARFRIHFEEDFSALLPHLTIIKNLERLLRLRVAAELAAGQTDQAFADEMLSFRLRDSLREEMFLVSHAVRMAAHEVSMQGLWEGCTTHRWNEKQLAEFQQQLEQLNFIGDYPQVIRGERAFANHAFAAFGQHPREFARTYNDQGILRLGRLAPSGWIYQNQVAVNRYYQRILAIDVQSREAGRGFQDLEQSLGRPSPYNVIARLIVPALGKVHESARRAQTITHLALLACALERYRLVHGQYPETLHLLSPQFARAVPVDVITGEALKYRRTEAGEFILYSVGADRADDGGTPSANKPKSNGVEQGDWVWTFPKR